MLLAPLTAMLDIFGTVIVVGGVKVDDSDLGVRQGHVNYEYPRLNMRRLDEALMEARVARPS